MQALRQAFSRGLRDALRHPRLLLPLYVCGLLLGLVQTWPLLAALAGGALRNPFLGDLARGGGDALADLYLGAPMSAGGAALWALAVLPLTGLFSLTYNFFSGGILSVYAGSLPFWAGCRRNFAPFTALGLLLVVLLALPVAAASALSGALGLGGAAGLLVAPPLILLLNSAGEYARAMAIVSGRRNPFALIGMAAGFCLRNFGGVLALMLAGTLLHAALIALYASLAGALAGSPALIVWQQLAVLAWLWVKLLRLAWALGYLRATGDAQKIRAASPRLVSSAAGR